MRNKLGFSIDICDEIVAAVEEFLPKAEELGYDNYHIDGDHGIGVVNIKDILEIIQILEEMK